ncbi:MAG TPA: hypothetical protein VGA04_29350 [Streptosporangiaceae bacterium]
MPQRVDHRAEQFLDIPLGKVLPVRPPASSGKPSHRRCPLRNFIAQAHTVPARQARPEPGGLKGRSQPLVPVGVPALP